MYRVPILTLKESMKTLFAIHVRTRPYRVYFVAFYWQRLADGYSL